MYSYRPASGGLFELPAESTCLWRYQTLPKLLSLLDSRKLFFCRAAKFTDPFEGAWPKHAVDRDAEMYPDRAKTFQEQRVMARDIMAISCWHMSTYESAAMWSVYGLNGEGVAIKSSVGSLTAALPKKQVSPGRQELYSIYVGQVRYIDYSTVPHFVPDNMYYPYMHKRQSFDYEKELRAITAVDDVARAAFNAGTADFEVTDGGVAIPVDVKALIQGIYIAPLGQPSFEKVVRSTVARFGFESIPVVKSPMAEAPFY